MTLVTRVVRLLCAKSTTVGVHQASGKRKQRQEEETSAALPHNGSGAQHTGAQMDACVVCDDSASTLPAAGGTVAAAVAAEWSRQRTCKERGCKSLPPQEWQLALKVCSFQRHALDRLRSSRVELS